MSRATRPRSASAADSACAARDACSSSRSSWSCDTSRITRNQGMIDRTVARMAPAGSSALIARATHSTSDGARRDQQRRASVERDRRDDHDVVDGPDHRPVRLHDRQQHGGGGDEHQADEAPARRHVAGRHAHPDAGDVEDEPEHHQRAVAVQPRLGLRRDRDDEQDRHRRQTEHAERRRRLLEDARSHPRNGRGWSHRRHRRRGGTAAARLNPRVETRSSTPPPMTKRAARPTL